MSIDLAKYKQPDEYSCGPYALAYVLKLSGYEYDPEYLRIELGTTEEGTKPQAIKDFLARENIKYSNANQIDFFSAPSLINIEDGGDRHWVVWVRTVSEGFETYVEYYDPYAGLIKKRSWDSFDRVWIPRPGGDNIETGIHVHRRPVSTPLTPREAHRIYVNNSGWGEEAMESVLKAAQKRGIYIPQQQEGEKNA